MERSLARAIVRRPLREHPVAEMSGSLSKRISLSMKGQPARRSGQARAAVIALRDDIQKAVDDGWSIMAIWRQLHAEGAVGVGYHAFRRCVVGLLSRPTPKASSAAIQRTAPAGSPNTAGFQHSPVPRKQDIYG